MKKILCLMLCVLVTVCFMPLMTWADITGSGTEQSPYQVTNATELATAAASGGEIILSASVSLSQEIEVPQGKEVTINLNGKTVTASNCHAFYNKGNLTIKGAGKVTVISGSFSAVANYVGANCTIAGGAYSSESFYAVKNLGTMTIGGNVKIEKPADSTNNASLIDNGWYGNAANDLGTTHSSDQKAKLIINSGSFKGNGGKKSSSVIKNDDYGFLEITGGTFDSTLNNNSTDATTILNWNVATISNGTFKGSYPITNAYCAGGGDQGQLTILGGEFTGSESLLGTSTVQGAKGGTLTIKGGTFTAPTIGNTTDKYDVSVMGGNFSDISVISKTATNANINVKLDKSMSITSAITIPKDRTVTVDLNGKTVTASNCHAFYNKGNLTIKGAGKVTVISGSFSAVANYVGASCTIAGGAYSSESFYAVKNLGTMTIGGNVKIEKPADSTNNASLIDNGWYGNAANDLGTTHSSDQKAKLIINSGSFKGNGGKKSSSVIKNDDYGFLEITGGTFDSTLNNNSTDATTILNWNVATISNGTFKGSYPITNAYCAGGGDQGQLTILGGEFTGSESLLGTSTVQGAKGGTLTIKGGTFTASTIGNITDKYDVSVMGGTFSSSPKSPVNYVATGKKVYKTSTGKYIVAGSNPQVTSGGNGYYFYWNTYSGKDADMYEQIVYYQINNAAQTTTTTTNTTTTTTTTTQTQTIAKNSGNATIADNEVSIKTTNLTTTTLTTSTTTINTNTAKDMEEAAIDGKVANIEINATTTKGTSTTATVDIPLSTVKTISEKAVTDITINTDVASIIIDPTTQKAIVSQAKGTTVDIVAKNVSTSTSEARFELSIISGGTKISDFNGGNVQVTVEIPASIKTANVACVYLGDSGNAEKMAGKKNADGTYTFTAGHFSTYVLMTETDADALVAKNTTVDTVADTANLAELERALLNIKISTTTSYTSAKSIKIKAKITQGLDTIVLLEDMGYTVSYKFYRSTNKSSGYKLKSTKKATNYVNTSGTKGMKYYYKTRILVTDSAGNAIGITNLKQSTAGSRVWKK